MSPTVAGTALSISSNCIVVQIIIKYNSSFGSTTSQRDIVYFVCHGCGIGVHAHEIGLLITASHNDFNEIEKMKIIEKPNKI